MAYIIGHRGAAGLALENTMASFKKAIEIGVAALEFDVHVTKDGQFVVCHDDHLGRVSDTNIRIKDSTYAELGGVRLLDGSPIPLLTEVLDLARAHTVGVIVELKIQDHLEAFCTLLDAYPDLDLVVASFKHDALGLVRKLRPELRLFLTEAHRPVEVLQKAKAMKAQGIDLNYKLLNPLTYWLAQRWNLHIMAYTVNSLWAKRIISVLYPNVSICTDHPEYFISRG